MDKFENLIKQAVEGHEMPFNPQAWENVSNELGGGFDQMMKESTSGYEAPYSPAAWEAVSSQLGSNYSVWKWIAGSAAVITAVIGSVYIFGSNTSELADDNSNQSSEIAINGNNTVANTSNHTTNNTTTTTTTSENSSNDASNIASNPVDNQVDLVDNGNTNVIDNGINGNDANDNSNHNSNPIVTPVDNTIVNQNGNNINQQEVVEYHANAGFELSAESVCVKQKCSFTPAVINSDLVYVWNFGDGQMSASAKATHTYAKAGEYNVTLEIKHPKTNGTIASSKEVITVNALPSTEFSFNQSSEAIPAVTFTNLTEEAVSSLWNIKGLKQSSDKEFEYTFRKAGNYSVGLTATNEFGCSKTIEKTVKIENDYNLLAPNAFGPNGDGDNDDFIPLALKIMDVEFTMTIMDKSGRQVYVTQNAFAPWDGRYTADNTMAPSGSSYIWRVILTNNNGEQELYEGQVFVVY